MLLVPVVGIYVRHFLSYVYDIDGGCHHNSARSNYQADGRGVEKPEDIGFEVSTSLIFDASVRVHETISAVLKHCSSPHLQRETLGMTQKYDHS